MFCTGKLMCTSIPSIQDHLLNSPFLLMAQNVFFSQSHRHTMHSNQPYYNSIPSLPTSRLPECLNSGRKVCGNFTFPEWECFGEWMNERKTLSHAQKTIAQIIDCEWKWQRLYACSFFPSLSLTQIYGLFDSEGDWHISIYTFSMLTA